MRLALRPRGARLESHRHRQAGVILERRPFDPASAAPDAVWERALLLRGRRLAAIAAAEGFKVPALRKADRSTKGLAGAIIEAHFGIRPNNDPRPDFIAAGIELKVIPLIKRAGKTLVVKERTSISMIDYFGLITETWATASVRKKLDSILFVFYSTWPGADIDEMKVEEALLWRLPTEIVPTVRADWMYVYTEVAAGKAHELTESRGQILGACTKGAGHGRTVAQPRNLVQAKPRAWSLKPSYTQALWAELRSREEWVSLGDALGTRYDQAVQALLDCFRRHVGKTLSEVSTIIGEPLREGKGAGGALVRAIAGLPRRSRIREFEETGILVKTTRVSPTGRPYESMSFPAMHFKEVAEEEWEDSEFRKLIAGLLIVPLIGERKGTPFARCKLGRPFLWRPGQHELDDIATEWRVIQQCIANSNMGAIPPASMTEYIHVRPHGRDRSDVDVLPDGTTHPKQSFWLNKDLVEELVQRHQ